MKRKITKELINWKEAKRFANNERLPILIYGARQVGKTYEMQAFGSENYKNTIYINFEKMEHVGAFFDSNISPTNLISRLESFSGQKIIPGQTLIIFDEIQSCERALTSLKYFAEDAPEYHIVAAGSLLGVAVNRGKFSFPVGKVRAMHMFPMDIEEFLWAHGEEYLCEDVRICYNESKPISDVLHRELLKRYVDYLITGGMPSAVKDFINKKNFLETTRFHEDILNAYTADMAKYSTSGQNMRIKSSYDSMPSQLTKENKKFQYKLVRKGATANLFGESIEWLLSAGIVLKCDKIDAGISPLEAQKDISSFKLFMSDVGLYRSKAKLTAQEIINGNYASNFKGALAESYVAQSLISGKHSIYYWESKSKAEVDFVIQDSKQNIVPIEVKSGENVRSKSLGVFASRYQSPYSIRISAKNFGFENNIKSVPLYAVFCI